MNITTCHRPPADLTLANEPELDFDDLARVLTTVRWGRPQASKAELREARMKSLQELSRMHTLCESEDPEHAIDEWTETLSRFESEELLEVMDYAVAATEEAWDAEQPFHFSACLTGMLMEWSHNELCYLENQGGGDDRLSEIFEAACDYFNALRQEADVLELLGKREMLRAA